MTFWLRDAFPRRVHPIQDMVHMGRPIYVLEYLSPIWFGFNLKVLNKVKSKCEKSLLQCNKTRQTFKQWWLCPEAFLHAFDHTTYDSKVWLIIMVCDLFSKQDRLHVPWSNDDVTVGNQCICKLISVPQHEIQIFLRLQSDKIPEID